jgi:hypothetical protein
VDEMPLEGCGRRRDRRHGYQDGAKSIRVLASASTSGFGDYSLTPARMGLVEHVLGIPIVKDEAKLEGVPRSIFWELFEPFAVRMGSHGAHGAVRRPEPIGPGGIVLDVEDSDVVLGAGILVPGAGTT